MLLRLRGFVVLFFHARLLHTRPAKGDLGGGGGQAMAEVLKLGLPRAQMDKLMGVVFHLQRELMEKDRTIHRLNQQAVREVELEKKRDLLKQRFSVIEKRYVDTSSTTAVLKDSLNHLLYAVSDVFSGTCGMLLLDVPYNTNLGATNKSIRDHSLLDCFWHSQSTTPRCLVEYASDVARYHNIATQRVGHLYFDEEVNQMRADDPERCSELRSLCVCPVVAERVTIGLLVVVNGTCDTDDVAILVEVLQELWTSNISPLINLAMENVWKKESEASLSHETIVRDEIILSLDNILDEVVQQTLASATHGRSVSQVLWRTILQRVSNFFEEYFESDAIMAVTNAGANFKVQQFVRSQQGSRTGSLDVNSLAFTNYVFSDSLQKLKQSAGLSHPSLASSELLKRLMVRGDPFYTEDPTKDGVAFPCGHLKVTNMILVPILFCDEAVGLLGLANGEFSVSSGRVLQSVFTTFWTMIVKATLMSESQKVLNAALPKMISDRFKAGETIADSYPCATVLFADIVGYTSFTKDLPSEEAVEYSNLIFARLDALVDKCNLEFIKTIGDCYMVAGGVQDKSGSPTSVVYSRPTQGQMVEMLAFADQIIKETETVNSLTERDGVSARVIEGLRQRPLQFRIGVAEGSLTAGVFGSEKVQYDVLGRTANLASRLESSGMPGRIHVSSSFYTELHPLGHMFEKRDPLPVKGLGVQQTYFYLGKGKAPAPLPVSGVALGTSSATGEKTTTPTSHLPAEKRFPGKGFMGSWSPVQSPPLSDAGKGTTAEEAKA